MSTSPSFYLHILPTNSPVYPVYTSTTCTYWYTCLNMLSISISINSHNSVNLDEWNLGELAKSPQTAISVLLNGYHLNETAWKMSINPICWHVRKPEITFHSWALFDDIYLHINIQKSAPSVMRLPMRRATESNPCEAGRGPLHSQTEANR